MLNKKDEKIFIDLDDEITFVLERIRDSEADRIVLVAPEGAAVISSVVSLKLLHKLVFKAGKSLILVTLDESALKFARRTGIPTVKRIADLNDSMWLESEEKLRKRGLNPIIGRENKIKKEDEILNEKEFVSEENNEVITEEDDSEDVLDNNDDNITSSIKSEDSEDSDDNENEEIPSFLKKKSQEKQNDTVSDEPSLEDFGFVVGEDIAKKKSGIIEKQPEKIIEKREYVSDFVSEEESNYDNLKAVGRDMSGYELKSPVREKIKPKNVIGKIKKPKLKFPKINAKMLIPLVVVVLILTVIGGLYAYFIAPKATLSATVKYETVDLQQEIRASSDITDVDLENLKIPLILQEVEESGSDSRSATGSEVRGDKAKGKVTIINLMEEVIQLNSGIVLTSSGKNFVLLNNEELPAADRFAGTLGRLEVDVEAYDIGEEYNISSGSEFTVEGYASTAVAGKSFEDFTGGNKEEVTVVTAEDRDSLKNSLQESLEARVISRVKNQIGSGFEIYDDMIDVEVVEENYDVDAGTESDGVNLDMKVKARAYVYSTVDISTLGKQLLLSNVSTGLKLLEDQSEFNGEFLRRDGNDAVLNLSVMGVISGDVTESSIKDSIVGKSSQEVDSYLSSLDSITNYDIVLGPEWLPEKLRHIPNIKSNIDVILEVDKEESTEADTLEE